MQYAVLFPGQGSQAVGMLGELAEADPRIEATLKEASLALGWDLAKLVREGPEADLNQTQRTQPALLAAGIAVWRAWRSEQNSMPTVLAGHSLGEYTALVAAGALDFAAALKLVEYRGEVMQAAVPGGQGGMLALVGLDDAKVEEICKGYRGEGVLEPANYNAPGQVVVAGSRVAVDWLAANAKSLGARMAVALPMSVPSHCSLMRGAAEKLAARLEEVEIRTPTTRVLHNLDGAARTEPSAIRAALVEQLYRPVRWAPTVRAIVDGGVGVLLECGPGRVLTNLNKRITPESQFVALEKLEGLQQAAGLVANAEHAA